MLADASPNDLPGSDKYFFVSLQNNGRLRFALEDSADGDFAFQTGVNSIPAGTWTHIAVTWEMSGERRIYVNGSLSATDSRGTNGQIGALRTLYMGDNRSTYHPGGTANSANGIIDEVRIYSRPQTQAEIATDLAATHACTTSALDHFTITPATTMASTCLPNAITIVAEDASNSPITTYSNQVNITVSTGNGNWRTNSAANSTVPNPDNDDNGAVSYTFLAADAGDIILDLVNTHAESLTITVSDPIEGVTSSSVVVTYSSNVFVITEDPVQVAGRPQAMNIAMWTDDVLGSASCGIDPNYDYASVSLDASIDRNGVLPGAGDPSIGGVTIPDAAATASIDLDFSVTPGQVAFNLDTSDVGQYRLTISDNTNTHSDAVITGTSALLTVRPFGIGVSGISDTATATANPGNSTSALPIFTAAGNDMTATVAGVLWDSADDSNNDGVLDTGVYSNNPAAPSYAWDSSLLVSAAGYTPAGGLPGTLNNGLVLEAEFSSGEATITDLQYTEVGSYTMQSRAQNYLGVAGLDITGDDIVVGRFVPAGFDVLITDDGAFAETCGAFSYLGQSFGYATAPQITVRALNALGGITAQYRDGFNKLSATSVTVNASEDETTDGTDMLPLQVSFSAVPMGITRNLDGTTDYVFGADSYRYGPAAPVGFSKYAESQVAPFVADIDPEITTVDDLEVSTSFPADTYLLNPAGNSQRFGRLRMSNVHGSELNPLLMPVYTEYFDGASFRKNTLDTCTVLAAANLLLTGSPPGLSVPVVVNTPATAGDIDLSFPSPGAGNDGFVDTTADLNSASLLWLRYDWDADGEFDNDPGARATFGIFEGDPVQIYIQEIYQ